MKFAPEYVNYVLTDNFEDAKAFFLSPLMAIHYAHLVMLADTAIVSREDAHRLREALDAVPLAEEADAEDLAWTRLVVHVHETGPKADQAFVDFSAYYAEEGREHAIHEKSEFQRIDGEWFYTRAVRSGPAPVKSSHPKVGRNDPCPCGSGKKYKQCCLGRA